MSVSISELWERVATQLSDIEQVDKSIIRGTRKMGDVPFAVCYFDVAQELPGTPETLTKYQDRVIGSHYFDGGKSLQWNNYLYFITDRKHLEGRQALKAKELIESDRNYARKQVIAEEELDSVLLPAVITPTGEFPPTNILSVWVEHLVEAGLDEAILSSVDIPKRLDLIESPPPQPSTRPKIQIRRAQVAAAPFIRSLELKTFRPFPIQRSFEFGAVNLIFGANGSGKTSLLEALELFYCGKTKRNPTSPERYELVAHLGDGKTEKAGSSRGLQVFRDRNLNWYGQSEVKSTNLYQSFAQFNFLDTDAAVHLADFSSSEMEEDISKLLVGPDASKTWRDIERVNSAVDMKLKDLRPLEAQMKEDLEVLEKQVKEAGSVKRESDSIRVRLEEMVKHLGWSSGQRDKDLTANRFVESLAELVPLARQATELDWTQTPVSIDGLTKYCRESKVTSEKAEANITRLETLQKNQKRHSVAIDRAKEALELVRQANRFIDAGVLNRAVQRGKQENIVATISGWLAGLDTETLSAPSDANLQVTVEAWQKGAIAKRSAEQRALMAAKSEHSDFTKLRDQSVNLLQELRQVAGKILKNSTKPDECPLCHTEFGPGELAKHMVMGIDEHVESLGQELLSRVSAQEAAVQEASAVVSAANWLTKFCEDTGNSAGITVRLALAKVEDARRELAAASSQMEIMDKERVALEAQGLSAGRLEEISDRLSELGYPPSELSSDGADRLVVMIKDDSTTSSRTLETERTQVVKLEKDLTEVLDSVESNIQAFRAALARRKERLVTTERIRAKLNDSLSSFVWSAKKPLAELVVEAQSVRSVAVELQGALGREKLAQSSYSELPKRIAKLKDDLKLLGPRITRLAEAKSVLDQLQGEFSLETAMNSALQQNRASIEAIFSAIHLPREFRGLGATWTTLVRKADGVGAKLSEISTGQRAAFALSIFLAQNAQLTMAPPVVLIDDPIAHVDDLNSLSFLDYLRELALTGRRQIFFATANDKLASLFERKFDFLGKEGFRRFDLRREIN